MAIGFPSRAGGSREAMRLTARKVKNYSSNFMRWLVLENARVTGVFILAGGLTVVLVWMMSLVWFSRPQEVVNDSLVIERGLDTSAFDRLELWIEEVEDERRAGLILPDRAIFVADDLATEE